MTNQTAYIEGNKYVLRRDVFWLIIIWTYFVGISIGILMSLFTILLYG